MPIEYEPKLNAYVNAEGYVLSEAEILTLPEAERIEVLRAIEQRGQTTALKFLGITWDRTHNEYKNLDGTYLSSSQARFVIDDFIKVIEERLEWVTREFASNSIDLETWQAKFKSILKAAYIDSDAILKGGLSQLQPHDWTRLANRSRSQFKRIEKFARQLKTGKLTTEQTSAEARSYAAAVRTNYEQARQGLFSLNYKYSRRVLHGEQNCIDCAEWAAKGFVSSGVQPVIATLICGGTCTCTLEFTDDAPSD